MHTKTREVDPLREVDSGLGKQARCLRDSIVAAAVAGTRALGFYLLLHVVKAPTICLCGHYCVASCSIGPVPRPVRLQGWHRSQRGALERCQLGL